MKAGTLTCTSLPVPALVGDSTNLNRDQPLLHFYHKVFRGGARNPPPYVSEAKMIEGGDAALVAGLRIEFHR